MKITIFQYRPAINLPGVQVFKHANLTNYDEGRSYRQIDMEKIVIFKCSSVFESNLSFRDKLEPEIIIGCKIKLRCINYPSRMIEIMV